MNDVLEAKKEDSEKQVGRPHLRDGFTGGRGTVSYGTQGADASLLLATMQGRVQEGVEAQPVGNHEEEIQTQKKFGEKLPLTARVTSYFL